MTKSIDQDVLDVLAAGRTEGDRYYLPEGQLDRKLYTRVDAILAIAGGVWNRKVKAHVFPEPVDDALDSIILTGEVEDNKRDLQQFFTPPDLAQRVIELAQIRPGYYVLEPSAGGGALAVAAQAAGGLVHCVELDTGLAIKLGAAGLSVRPGDFLEMEPGRDTGGVVPFLFDRIVMNPPFTRQQDVQHVMHALKFLAPGGRLVAIVSAMAGKQNNRVGRAFSDWMVERGPDLVIHSVAAGAFKESGTMVETKILVVQS